MPRWTVMFDFKQNLCNILIVRHLCGCDLAYIVVRASDPLQFFVHITYLIILPLYLSLNKYAAIAPIATVLGSIPASVGTLESEGRQMKQCWIW